MKVVQSGYAELALLVLLFAYEARRTNKWFAQAKCLLYIMLVVSGGYYVHEASNLSGWPAMV